MVAIGPDIIYGAAVEAIVAAVDGAFPVYTEQVLQRFQTPSVFVFQTSCRMEQDLGDASWRVYKIEATFHAGKEAMERYQALRDWGGKLSRALHKLSVPMTTTADKPLRAVDIETKFFDDYVVVYVGYKLRCRESSTPPAPMDLSVNIAQK
jgi:hypothetical protein